MAATQGTTSNFRTQGRHWGKLRKGLNPLEVYQESLHTVHSTDQFCLVNFWYQIFFSGVIRVLTKINSQLPLPKQSLLNEMGCGVVFSYSTAWLESHVQRRFSLESSQVSSASPYWVLPGDPELGLAAAVQSLQQWHVSRQPGNKTPNML